MEVLNKVSVESPETKEFIDQKLQQKYFRGNITIEEVTFSLTSQSNIFYCAVLVFNYGTCFIARIVTSYVKERMS